MRKIKFISILLVLSMLLTVPVFAFSTGFTDVSVSGCNTEQLKMLVKLLRLVNSSPSGKTRWADKQ